MEEKSSATKLSINSSRLISFTYHVMVDKHNYSVPYQYVGQKNAPNSRRYTRESPSLSPHSFPLPNGMIT